MKNKISIFSCLLLICFSCLLFVGCTSGNNQYSITVKVSHYNLGSVEGGNKKYYEGEKIKIKANPAISLANNQNPEFVCWLHNNKAITTQAEYEFEVNEETAGDYVALFSCEFLEYFCLTDIVVNTGMNDDSNTFVKSLSIELGLIEGITKEVFSIEPTSQSVINIARNDIYQAGDNPFAYDMQEDIFVKFIITYEQDGVEFVSTTLTKVAGVLDVTLESIGFENTELNLATNSTDSDLTISLPNTPTLSLKFERLTTFEITDPEIEEQ